MPDFFKVGLRELAASVRDGRESASTIARAYLERIDAMDARVQAWEYLDRPRALSAARSVDTQSDGLLAGVPLAIKDIIDVSGMPTRFGSPVFADDGPCTRSADCVSRLERAGAVVLGKSVTTEFAYYTPGKTRNPWNPSHTPGGSSMGSAAAVACGMAAGALGTQTNGSIIRPAAFCGVVGFKPSLGAVSNDATLDPWPTLDHTGVFARDVADAALLASVIALPQTPLRGRIAMPARAPMLGLVRSPVWTLADPAQQAMLASNAATLAHAGAKVETLELPRAFDDAHRVHRTILAYEASRHFDELQKQHRRLLSARFNDLLDEGRAIAARDYAAAIEATSALRSTFALTLSGCDALITPPAAGEAPATLDQTGDPAFCTIWTLLGVPAISIPVGIGPRGLPIGLQLIGVHREDDRLLDIAAWCGSHLPFSGKQTQ